MSFSTGIKAKIDTEDGWWRGPCAGMATVASITTEGVGRRSMKLVPDGTFNRLGA